MHWFDSLGWIMVEFMYVQVTKVIMVTISIANYVAFTCDEVNTMDNGSWISIHPYMMLNWVKVPMMLFLQRVVNGLGFDNLIVVIMEAL
jgi:hypothetical protein